MPQPRRARKPADAPVPAETAAAPPTVLAGYLPAARPRYRWIEYAAGVDGGGEPLRAEIRTNLTWGEIDSLNEATIFAEVWERLAPHVRAWNALGIDAVTGEATPAPPPMEAGPDAFKAIDAEATLWLLAELRTAHLGGEERKKDAPALARSPAPASDAPSD